MLLGVVVQNNDPQKRGRVKVFIPHVSLNMTEKWEKEPKDKSFYDLSDPIIKDAIDEIKHRLPWANYAAPIFGEVGNHYYDSYNKKNDSKTDDKTVKSETDNFGYTYESNQYNDSAKGLFSIPRVGSRVWVFFENGNPNRPVYFATAYSKDDWDGITNESGDYPEKLENYSKKDGESPDTTYKNKMVISQRGAIIEIVNTESEESIQISQHNGSFKVWNNKGIQEYTNGNDRKYVDGGQTLHVGGNMNVYIEGNADILVNGTYTVESKGNMKFKAPRIDFNP